MLRQAIEVAREQDAKSWELRTATSLARLLKKQDRQAEALDVLQPVYRWFTEGRDTRDLREAAALLTEIARDGANPPHARSSREEGELGAL
jgi:predicted ATPase